MMGLLYITLENTYYTDLFQSFLRSFYLKVLNKFKMKMLYYRPSFYST